MQELVEERKGDLANFLKDHFPNIPSQVKIKQEVVVGNPFRKIVEKAKEESVDMIILSTHGRTGILHLLIGSVTEQVVRRATSPVLTIRPEAKE